MSTTYRMNAQLREMLHDAIGDITGDMPHITGEDWPVDEKMRCHNAIDDLRDGDEIPYAVSEEFPAADVDADEPLPIVASLIEYFGLDHVVTTVRDFSNFCFCPTPDLDTSDTCRKCGTHWS